ncbi:Prophage PssSM-02, DNA methylase N-4/N-6 [Pseudomonas amygdali pv. tabaci]|uniref:Prophage PssSM-02, DNA methylase N-4/N-6 n=1 Tax=Pseudomonas amygdali pv. tabaci TaxID=322 RepID=A0AAX1VNX6_PSEAJ|nr:DNA methylase N-4/N-6 [Pseudomonas amygdali pv. tabaci]RML76147.1 Prophage PssSM-02, DNA methylase N-4/N-6 [Pseudomonas amygdali pv. tabaci]
MFRNHQNSFPPSPIALNASAGACLEFDMSQLHQILVGDCIDMMRTLPDESVHTCVNG